MRSSSSRVLTTSLVVLILTGPACATRTAGPTAPAPPVAPPANTLAHTLDALLSTPPFDRVVWGVSIRVPGAATLYQRNAHLMLHPASNMKLVTLAAAADRLGWDFRFQTTIRSTTGVAPDGTLAGDLVVDRRRRPDDRPTARRRGDAGAPGPIWCGSAGFAESRAG